MKLRRTMAGMLAVLSVMACMTGCGEDKGNDSSVVSGIPSEDRVQTTQPVNTESVTETTTEATMEPVTEATKPNQVGELPSAEEILDEMYAALSGKTFVTIKPECYFKIEMSDAFIQNQVNADGRPKCIDIAPDGQYWSYYNCHPMTDMYVSVYKGGQDFQSAVYKKLGQWYYQYDAAPLKSAADMTMSMLPSKDDIVFEGATVTEQRTSDGVVDQYTVTVSFADDAQLLSELSPMIDVKFADFDLSAVQESHSGGVCTYVISSSDFSLRNISISDVVINIDDIKDKNGDNCAATIDVVSCFYAFSRWNEFDTIQASNTNAYHDAIANNAIPYETASTTESVSE